MSSIVSTATIDYPISEDPQENFNVRLISMMEDYGVSLSEALEWDFEGFHNNIDRSEREGMLEADFQYYLFQNTVDPQLYQWYTDVFTGKLNDMVLKRQDTPS